MNSVLLAAILYEGSFQVFIVMMILGMYSLHRMINRVDSTGGAKNAAARSFFGWLFGKIK